MRWRWWPLVAILLALGGLLVLYQVRRFDSRSPAMVSAGGDTGQVPVADPCPVTEVKQPSGSREDPPSQAQGGASGSTMVGPSADAGVETRGDQTSVIEAITDRTHPERLMPLARPQPFDPEAYARDPEAWLKVIEPGRIFQMAQPGAGMARIRCVGPSVVRISDNATCVLQVQVVPGAPVTFHAFEYGQFANGLATLSVRADATGLAQVTLLVPAQTTGNGHVQAACPLTTGCISFLIEAPDE